MLIYILFTLDEVNFTPNITGMLHFVYHIEGKYYPTDHIFQDEKRKFYGIQRILFLAISVYLLRKFYLYQGT